MSSTPYDLIAVGEVLMDLISEQVAPARAGSLHLGANHARLLTLDRGNRGRSGRAPSP